MFPAVISDSNHLSESQMPSSISPRLRDFVALNSILISNNQPQLHPQKSKKKRNLPGNPDPDAEVIALSPKTLLATNRFVCEICNKGFQRDQNLQLHRRGHNLPWKLKQRSSKEMKKRAYVCPEASCLHHHPSRALGDLTGIKKHYCRKHGEKKWKCDKCSKIYAVQSDWKAHGKTCGTREYRCDCGTLFSRKDSFITHRAFCDALAEESARLSATSSNFLATSSAAAGFHFNHQPPPPPPVLPPLHLPFSGQNPNPLDFDNGHDMIKHEPLHYQDHTIMSSNMMMPPHPFVMPPLSATTLLQRAAAVVGSSGMGSTMAHLDMHVGSTWQDYGKNIHDRDDDIRFTRDFLGLTGDQSIGGGNVGDHMLTFTGSVKFQGYDGNYGFTGDQTCSGWGNC